MLESGVVTERKERPGELLPPHGHYTALSFPPGSHTLFAGMKPTKKKKNQLYRAGIKLKHIFLYVWEGETCQGHDRSFGLHVTFIFFIQIELRIACKINFSDLAMHRRMERLNYVVIRGPKINYNGSLANFAQVPVILVPSLFFLL